MNLDIYIADEAYDAMLDELEEALRDPGHDLRTKIVEIVGRAGVWPASCLADQLAEAQRRRRSPA